MSKMSPSTIGPAAPPTRPKKACTAIVDPRTAVGTDSVIAVEYMDESADITQA